MRNPGRAPSVSVSVMRRIALCALALTILHPPAATAQETAGASIPYLNRAPIIDGLLDSGLERLAPRTLPIGPLRPDVRAPIYRLAYGASFLYAFVEIEAPELATRDRAYQNGDGVVLVVARPRLDDSPTDEFFVLGFSPGTPAARWQQKFVWYRNVSLEMQPLPESLVATASRAGRSAFEILVPWRDIYPFHPWLTDGIGFNVCVTRALAENGRARFCAVDDNRVDSEQNNRRYERLVFEAPEPDAPPEVYAVLDRNHVDQGAPVRLRVARAGPAASIAAISVRVLSGEGTRLDGRQVPVSPGSMIQDVEVPSAALAAGGYMVGWEAGPSSGRIGLTVLPSAGAESLRRQLERARPRIKPGSATTIAFRVDEFERERRALKPNDTAAQLRLAAGDIVGLLDAAAQGRDILLNRTGSFRRAFRSRVDQTLQPYTIQVPTGYRAERRYPLLVFLHGSGEDDTTALARDWLPQNFILLAPKGRGTSNWYSADHAQDDVREAFEDVLVNYSVDRGSVVLAGFSMGGYGVYRTYSEDPSRYSALAVFSGIPRAPMFPTAPEFLEQADLTVFKRVPIFIFHGGKDRNCPIEDTQALVGRLRQAGASVQFELEPDKGHERPGASTIARFHAWLQGLAK